MVKEIKAGAGTESAIHFEPEVVEKIEMSDENYHAIIDGMRKVSETGTASNVFASYEIPVGGKTGTASVPSGTSQTRCLLHLRRLTTRRLPLQLWWNTAGTEIM